MLDICNWDRYYNKENNCKLFQGKSYYDFDEIRICKDE